MRKIKHLFQTFLMGIVITISLAANATDANVTVQVWQSDGTTALSGVAVTYKKVYSYNFGYTDANGQVSKTLATDTYDFTVAYKGSSNTRTVTVSGDMTIVFYTTTVSVNVSSCTGTNIQNVEITYYNTQYGYFLGSGNTDNSGNESGQLFPGTFDFKAKYNGTSATQTAVTVPGDGATSNQSSSLVFHPTTVTDYNTGSTYTVPPYSYFAYGTRYMFPGTYQFNFGAYSTNIVISGCTKSFTANILVLKDHNGNPLAGGHGRGGFGNNYGTWYAGGSSGAATDANGVLIDIVSTNSQPTTMSYEMKYNNTTTVLKQDVSQPNGNVFNFQTIELRLRLEKCSDNTGLSGGSARWGFGATFSTYYFPSPNSTNANGEEAAEWFPGTYSFEMNYQSTSNVKSSVTIPNANTVLTWQTTNLTLSWPYDIAYGGTGDLRYFNKPSMDLLPGTVNFNFRSPNGSNYTPITISGCTMSLTAGNVRLINSTGGPISGGSVDGYQGGWSNYGTTDANGNLLVLGKNPTSLAMTYVGGRQQMNGINFSVTPVVVFQTKAVTMELTDHNGNYTLEADNNSLSYYAAGWKTFGSGSTSGGKETMEMLPVTYSFAMTYKGGRQQISNQNVGTTPVVTFQTIVVTMELKDHNGGYTLEADNNSLSYYAGGWKTFGSGNTSGGQATMEMLPVTYSFALTYGGGRQQISNQNVNINPLVAFQTNLANMYLLDNNSTPISGGSATYYAGGWKNVGTTDVNGLATIELLPVSYSFKMAYNGKSNQQNNILVPADMYFIYDGSSITYSATPPNNFSNSNFDINSAKANQVVTKGVNIFPNPASDQVKITFGSDESLSSEIKIINLSGRVIMRKPISVVKGQNTYIINVGSLSNGTYSFMIGNIKDNKNKIVVMH